MQFLTAKTPQTSKITVMRLAKNILFLMCIIGEERFNKENKHINRKI